MKPKICTDECPLPICNLPDLLSPKQMRMAMTHLELTYKQMSHALHMGESAICNYMRGPENCREKNKWISDYLKQKLTEKKSHA